MPHQHRLRGPLAIGLLLLQLSLLTISGFHFHDEGALPNRGAPAAVHAAPASHLPGTSDWILCPVCQIMRLSAARPALASASRQSLSYSFFALGRVPVYCLSLRPATIYGRAPPLS